MDNIKKFKDVPWKDPTFEDIWYASYDTSETGHRIYVPKENTIGCIAAAFAAAYKVGETMVGLKQCHAFTVSMENGAAAGQTVGWPHIHLFAVNQPDPVPSSQ